MKQLFILLSVLFFSYPSDAQVRVIKMECASYDSYIKNFCSGCSLSQSNFNGILITENKVKTYLWHPIKVVTNGGIVALTDAFGTHFRAYASHVVGLNNVKNVFNFINNCAGTAGESVGAVVSGNFKFFDDLQFMIQPSTDPVKFVFTSPVFTGSDTTAIGIDSLQDFKIKKIGNYKIESHASFIPTVTGQYFLQVRKNGDVISEHTAQCASIVTGYINLSGTITAALVPDDIITMTLVRPAGAATYNVFSSNITITKL